MRQSKEGRRIPGVKKLFRESENSSKTQYIFGRLLGGLGIQNIKVLAAGCKSCHEMYENIKKTIEAAGINVEVKYVTDMEIVMIYGSIPPHLHISLKTESSSGSSIAKALRQEMRKWK